MRDLLLAVNPSTWSMISAVVFGIAFTGIILFVYWPGRKQRYQHVQSLPLEKD